MTEGRPVTSRFTSRDVVWLSLVATLAALLCTRRIAESDIWYHLRNAAETLARRDVIRADSYTFTELGAPIVDYEWLSELLYHAAFTRWGQLGLLAVYTSLVILAYVGVYVLARWRDAGRVEAALVTAFAVALGSYSFGPRMMHFGWLCLVALMLLLEASTRRTWLLWLIPPLFALWINLHGSWLFGIVVFGATGLDGMLRFRSGRVVTSAWPPRFLARALGAGALTIAALFVNPYGMSLVLYPFDLRFRQESAMAAVIEWQSVNFQDPYGKLALAMLIGLLAVAWLSRQEWKLRDLLLTVFALWASMTYVRFLGFAGFLLAPIVAPRVRLVREAETSVARPLVDIALSAVLLLMVLIKLPSNRSIEQHLEGEFPRGAVAFMKEHRIDGRLFNLWDFGGYLEWHLPGLKTFADGRADIFAYKGTLDDYMRAISIDQSLEILDKHRIQYVLYTTGGRLSYLLSKDDGWRVAYSDSVATLFERAP